MALLILAAILVVARSLTAAEDRLGSVEFFGAGTGADALRDHLPLKPGMPLPEDDAGRARLLQQIEQAVVQHTGKPPTDIAPVCCDAQGHWIFYIGIQGPRVAMPPSRRAQAAAVRVPQALLDIYRQTLEQNVAAVTAGATEDHTNGYALSTHKPLRDLQLQLRQQAVPNATILYTVLRQSSATEHRAAAATAIGYLDPSAKQIRALLDAAFDPDSTVRNNALRALWVLSVKHAARVLQYAPMRKLAALLRSGQWSDRNKALLLLMSLAQTQNKALGQTLRSVAMPELQEMSRWQNPGHSDPARVLLRFVAGL